MIDKDKIKEGVRLILEGIGVEEVLFFSGLWF